MANDDYRGMAECMEMLRCDLVTAGVVSEWLAPMFYSEAIIALVKSMRQEIERLRNAAA